MLNPLVVLAGFEVHVLACPDTLKITVPVGACRALTPVTTAEKIKEEPVNWPVDGELKAILGATDPKLMVIVAEVALK